MARGALPDFFIVGNAKSGTTALYSMLRRHPQIFMPDSKEPWFFAEELHERTPPRPEGAPRTLEQYEDWFAGAEPGQRVGEATPLYLWSRTAASRIAEVRPDARIVAILREPASFLRSLHMQFVESYVETENDFAKALALEPDRREGRRIPRYTYWPQALLYSDHVRYVEQLRRYHAVFPREQVLVLIYDDFKADNDAVVREVLRFLDVDDAYDVGSVQANPSVRARSGALNDAVHALSVGRGPVSQTLRRAVKAVTPTSARRRAVRAAKRRVLYADPGPPDERLMAELRRTYAPEVAALSEYLGRDLVKLWGYEEAAEPRR